jgi:hypothetical protein
MPTAGREPGGVTPMGGRVGLRGRAAGGGVIAQEGNNANPLLAALFFSRLRQSDFSPPL